MTGVGIDLLEIERLERALARRPRLAERLFTDGERAYAAARRAAGAGTSPCGSAPRRRWPRRSRCALELARRRGRSAAATGRRPCGWAARPPRALRELGATVHVSLTHSKGMAGAVAVVE